MKLLFLDHVSSIHLCDQPNMNGVYMYVNVWRKARERAHGESGGSPSGRGREREPKSTFALQCLHF